MLAAALHEVIIYIDYLSMDGTPLVDRAATGQMQVGLV